MYEQPLISCIIPTHNRSRKITNAIQSIKKQTYENIEIIVVDDQSTDNTKEVVLSLARDDNRIRYFFNPRKGANNARNYGLRNAAAEYIAMLDDDDIWTSKKLEKQMACFLSHPKAGMVFTAFTRIDGKGRKRRHPSYFSIIRNKGIKRRLLKQNFITTSSILVSKDVFCDTGGFDPRFKSFQDWELITRIVLKYPVFYVNRAMVIQCESADSITRDKKRRIISGIQHLKKFIKVYQKSPLLLSYRYINLGSKLLKQKKYLFAYYFFVRSFKINPMNPGVLLAILLFRLKKVCSKIQ